MREIKKPEKLERRNFIRTMGLTAAAALVFPKVSWSLDFKGKFLQVWSCGGLTEAFTPANRHYEKKTGVKIGYTGAFAAALGKTLLAWGKTDIFAGRVLKLAKKLRAAGKMAYFKPLCFTEYVLITQMGNPAEIESIKDLGRASVRVILAPDASPPGGAAVLALLSKAGVKDATIKNAVVKGSCVQMIMHDVISGKGDVSIVERRLTHIPYFAGKVDVIPIPYELQPPPPLTFTIGVMNCAENRALSDHYVDFITSREGQVFFERQGFIPAISERGRMLINKFGVKDA